MKTGTDPASPPCRPPLMRFAVAAECRMRRPPRPIGLPVFGRRRPPSPRELGFILSCACASPESAVLHPPPPSPTGAPSLGFPPALIAASARGVVTTGSHSRRLSVLGVSHALDGFIRLAPRGSVSPRYHVQGSLVQGLAPPPQPRHLVGGRCPLVLRRADFRRRCGPSGRCSASEFAASRERLSPRSARSPRRVSLLQVLPPITMEMPSHPLRP